MSTLPILRPHLIRQGQHRPQGALCRALTAPYLRAPEAFVLHVLLTHSCWYEVVPGVNDQLHKLGGYSRGLHHHNSTRLVWRPAKSWPHFELFVYEYRDGRRPTNDACEHWCTVNADELRITEIVYVTDRGPSWGYRLGPHFEGPDGAGAPHDMLLYTALHPIR
jgi:hypothetical protein